jgi:Zn-finger nucleic acid-binding protein
MNCISCGVEVSPAFKHALSQNVCPACGGALIDEESLALIEDLGSVLTSEATLRQETAHKLAIALVSRYEIQLRGQGANLPTVNRARPSAPIKMASGSTKKLIEDYSEDKPGKIITTNELQKIAEEASISDMEREAIMADAVSKHYNMIDQTVASTIVKGESNPLLNGDLASLNGSIFSEGQEVPILERERLLRLQKQQGALRSGGKNSFSRGG